MTSRLKMSFAALALVLSALMGGGAEARTTLHRSNAEPDTLDPHKMKLLSELAVLREIFEGLTKSDAQGRIVGGAAVRRS